MEFCSPFDAALAQEGPAAVFLPDRDGALRFDATWTRDCWGRAPGPHRPGWTWLLTRDRASGFVNLVLVTSPTLLTEHPRLDLRRFTTLEQAQAALSALDHPPFAREPW